MCKNMIWSPILEYFNLSAAEQTNKNREEKTAVCDGNSTIERCFATEEKEKILSLSRQDYV